jgi:NAD(P)-dependent dehydrogenase (short-subunit alcohol dehydrogenase family)
MTNGTTPPSRSSPPASETDYLSRGGVKQLTMSFADDWGIHGITVNCLALGWFKTRQNAVMCENQEWVEDLYDRVPLKRPGPPQDL